MNKEQIADLLARAESAELLNIDHLISRTTKNLQMLHDTSSSEAHLNDCEATLAMLHHLRARFNYLVK